MLLPTTKNEFTKIFVIGDNDPLLLNGSDENCRIFCLRQRLCHCNHVVIQIAQKRGYRDTGRFFDHPFHLGRLSD